MKPGTVRGRARTAGDISADDFVALPVGWAGRWDVTEALRKAEAIF